MAQTKKNISPKVTKPKSKVVVRGNTSTMLVSSKKVNSILLVIFAVMFGGIGYYLLRNGFADTGTTITVASWNGMKDNKNNIAGEAKSILGSANVVGLQEVHTAAQRNNIQKLITSNKYAVSPKAHSGNTNADGVESYPIIWREKEFSRVDEGGTGKVSPALSGLRARYITWVKLKQRVTGKQFYVVNTHMVRDVDASGSLTKAKKFQDNVDAYKGHMAKLVGLLEKLQKDKLPIFVTGDFAMDYRKDAGTVSIFPKAALGAIGVKSNWQLTNLQGIAPNAETYGGGSRLIDYVFAWNVTPKNTSIGKSKHGSDHRPVYFTADLSSNIVDTR